MAKPIRRKEKRRKPGIQEALPLSRSNYMIIGAGLIVIIAGYIAMLEGSVEGFLPLVLAPILLVLGYCVLIPLGILFKRSLFARSAPAPGQSADPGAGNTSSSAQPPAVAP